MGHIVPPHSEDAQMYFLYVLWYFEDEIMVFEIISSKYGVLVRVSSLLAAVIARGFWLSCLVKWSVEKKTQLLAPQCNFLIISPPLPHSDGMLDFLKRNPLLYMTHFELALWKMQLLFSIQKFLWFTDLFHCVS